MAKDIGLIPVGDVRHLHRRCPTSLAKTEPIFAGYRLGLRMPLETGKIHMLSASP